MNIHSSLSRIFQDSQDERFIRDFEDMLFIAITEWKMTPEQFGELPLASLSALQRAGKRRDKKLKNSKKR